jgi:type I phosphodiesterase/nucleotide pyrophosphatase
VSAPRSGSRAAPGDVETRLAFVVVDGLPVEVADRVLPTLPFSGSRLTHRSTAISCFPSTTGPAYFPLLAGCTPGRANVPGIRWFDRTRPTSTAFPHRGLRSYVGPDARKMKSDTKVVTMFSRHAWPASSPVDKDLPKRGELGRDAIWSFAHFTHLWGEADHRTSRKLGRGLRKGREIVFAVFPSVDEIGHVRGFGDERLENALARIDRLLEKRLGEFEGEIVLTADHGLTETDRHIDLRGLVEEHAGPTIAFPLVGKRNPEACVCESGNAMANVYLRGESAWRERPDPDRCRELAAALLEVEGIDSVALRGGEDGRAELWTHRGVGEAGFGERGLFARGPAFDVPFEDATPAEALEVSATERWPDAAFALASLFASDRTGDLLVSAAEGFDLRTAREWPEHHASHGALHRAHTLVPVWSSVPLPSGPLRTLDLFSYALRLAGIPLEDYPGSDAALLAEGRWQPEVLA